MKNQLGLRKIPECGMKYSPYKYSLSLNDLNIFLSSTTTKNLCMLRNIKIRLSYRHFHEKVFCKCQTRIMTSVRDQILSVTMEIVHLSHSNTWKEWTLSSLKGKFHQRVHFLSICCQENPSLYFQSFSPQQSKEDPLTLSFFPHVGVHVAFSLVQDS